MKYAILPVMVLVVVGVTYALYVTFSSDIALPLALLCSVVLGGIAGVMQLEAE